MWMTVVACGGRMKAREGEVASAFRGSSWGLWWPCCIDPTAAHNSPHATLGGVVHRRRTLS